MRARIYQPTKTAMQSGRAKTHAWVLEYEPTGGRLDPLMGWSGAGDTRGQLHLAFETVDDAIAYAAKHGIEYNLQQPKQRTLRPKAYADNFDYRRKVPWSH